MAITEEKFMGTECREVGQFWCLTVPPVR